MFGLLQKCGILGFYQSLIYIYIQREREREIFNNANYLQIDSTAQGPRKPYSYTDIAMAEFDKGALEHHLSPTIWKKFRYDIFVF